MSVTVRQAPVVNTVSITYTVSDRILVQEQFRIRPQTRRDLVRRAVMNSSDTAHSTALTGDDGRDQDGDGGDTPRT